MAAERITPQDGIAWVTGASSGIGAAVALRLARDGWTVAATARRLDRLEHLARAAENLPGRIVAHAGDVTDATTMRTLVETIETVHGPIALAFLNAGISAPRTVEGLDLGALEDTFAVNFFGVANGLAPVLKAMKQRGKGQIAVNASVAGYRGLPGAAAYGASKAALIHLAEALVFDCRRWGVTLQVVNPGFVETELTAGKGLTMPFLITGEEAGKRIVAGLASGSFEIAFPRRMRWLMKGLRLLPHGAYRRLMGRIAGRRGRPAAP